MEIRAGQYHDVTAYNRLARQFLEQSPYKDAGVRDGDLRQQFIRAVNDKNSQVLVAMEEKEMVGVMIGRVGVTSWGVKTAYDAFTYANRRGVTDKLIRRYLRWAEDKGAKLITMATSSGINERFDRLIEKHGLERVGSTFLRVR